ncbi:hypothetical protein M8120_24525 [Microcystis aeruginosa str. Chao 1910]|uniref:hypothetical protein n=1 Tax=Microcystis aeruginosa TaxID=1126 RepID=UPI0022472BD2|nr:hypothetical protein [Microcystis aeruginosa]UZO79127.1 hypothetical protein M8120_24525 [Microcystis aeruginosa str. Chao 1910]
MTTRHNQLSVISYQLSVISYQLSVISYQLSVISYQLSVISYQLSVISYQLSVIIISTKIENIGSSRLCVISLTYIGSIFVSSVSGVVPFTPAPAGLYLRIHFTHQIQDIRISRPEFIRV